MHAVTVVGGHYGATAVRLPIGQPARRLLGVAAGPAGVVVEVRTFGTADPKVIEAVEAADPPAERQRRVS